MEEKFHVQLRDKIQALGFAMMSHVLTCCPELSDGAYRLYALLLMYAQQKGKLWASEARLAEDLSVHRTTISRRIKELESLGLITREVRVGASYITWIEPLQKCTALPPVVAKMHARCSKNATTDVAEMLQGRITKEEKQDNNNKGAVVVSSSLSSKEELAFGLLQDAGIAEKQARYLAQNQPLERICEVIAVANRKVGIEDKSAWIYQALKCGWKLSPDEPPPLSEVDLLLSQRKYRVRDPRTGEWLTPEKMEALPT